MNRLAVCSSLLKAGHIHVPSPRASRAAQPAGLLDVTPSFKFNMLGPHCMRASLHPSVSTMRQSAFATGAQRGAHT
ncbi:hypothetical protein, partial [Dyella sp.]|uniref:hypothetical protein n=1 Tax=Dyella sp. TaxID=1869338 RepID=UPI002D79570B